MKQEWQKQSDPSETALEWIDLDEIEAGMESGMERGDASSRRGHFPHAAAAAIAVLLAGAVGVSLVSCGQAAQLSGQSLEQVGRRDITNYRSFSGTINPVDYQNVYPDVTGVKVKQILVEEGDEVHAGDVLIELDPQTILDQIEQQEAQLAVSSRTSALSVEQAQTQYNNYKYNIDNDLDSQLLSAKQQVESGLQQIDSAFSQLVTAQQAFNDEVGLNNQGFGSNLMQAKNGVDSAYQQVRSAQNQLEEAEKNVDAGLQDNTNAAQISLDGAWLSYNQAVQSYNASKINEENSLTRLYDQLVAAQFTYLNTIDNYNAAVRSYNAAVNSSQQQLRNYALQAESARAQADQSVSQLSIDRLYDQVEDCTVTAPIDGVVTSIPVKIGDSVTAATMLSTVTSFDIMKVDIKINEYDIGSVSKGSPVTITLDATGRTYEGEIASISRVATVQNGVSFFTSEVEFEADEDARSGMSAEVRLVISDLSQVLSAPSAAIETASDGTTYVLVPSADGKSQEQRPVTLGETDGNYVEIKDGLSEGDSYYVTSADPMAQMMMEMRGN